MTGLLAALLIGSSGAVAAEDGFGAACDKLAGEARIEAIFEDRPVTRDESRGLDELKRLAQSRSSRYHHVLGLTRAEPSVDVDFSARFLDAGDGRACAVPSLKIRLGFSVLRVYLAQELADPCRRRFVLEHEQEHVETWRAHFRAGARMLTPVLQARLARAYRFDSQAAAATGLRPLVEAQVGPLLQKLQDGVGAAQQQIDSAASYARVEARLRSCP